MCTDKITFYSKWSIMLYYTGILCSDHLRAGVNILFQELISTLKRSFDFVLTRGGEELPMYQVEFWFCPHKGGNLDTFDFVLRLFISFWTYN